MPKLTESQKRAKAKYNSKATKVQVELISPQDDDIIAMLNEQPSKQGYIKELIRRDAQKTQKLRNIITKNMTRANAIIDDLRFYLTTDAIGDGVIIVHDIVKNKTTTIDTDDAEAAGLTLVATTAEYLYTGRLCDSLDDQDDNTTPSLDTAGMKDVTKKVISELNKIYRDELNKS